VDRKVISLYPIKKRKKEVKLMTTMSITHEELKEQGLKFGHISPPHDGLSHLLNVCP
jgi:hypothetical protein